MINVNVKNISTISHLIMRAGKPVDEYTATVKFSEHGPKRVRIWFLQVYAPTENELAEKLKQYETDETIRISTKNLKDKLGGAYVALRK